MLPKIHRLPLRFARVELERVGQTFHTPLLTAVVAHAQPEPTRFAIIISKKISGSAVIRNKLRRQLVAALLPNLKTLKPGYNVLLLGKRALLEATFPQIEDNLNNLLLKAGLLNA